MTDEQFSNLRSLLSGATGVVCLIYAVLAIVMDRPDPMPIYIPSMLGILTAVVLFGVSLGFPSSARAATDERYFHIARIAAARAYWLSLAAFVILFIGRSAFHLRIETTVAAFGTLMGAAFLLAFVWGEWRDR